MKHSDKSDSALGMNASISRRDFLNGVLLSSAGLWTASRAPGGLFGAGRGRSNDGRSGWGGNTPEVFSAGHAVRDGHYDNAQLGATDTGEVFDLVVVGGGFSGLAAAYYFTRAKQGSVLVLENHPIVGGNARRDEFTVRGTSLYAPQASIVSQDLPPEFAPPAPVASIFQELNIDLDKIRVPKETSDFSAFSDAGGKAKWYASSFDAPMPDDVKKDFMAFVETIMPFYQKPDWQSVVADLDKYTFRDYAEKSRHWSPGLYKLMQPDLAAFFSMPDQISAAMVYAQYGGGPRSLYSFPGGNSGFLRHLLKQLIPDSISGGSSSDEIVRGRFVSTALDVPRNQVRVRLDSTAVRVEHEGSPGSASHVRVSYSHQGKLYSLKARGVVMAGGGYITKRVVRNIPDEKLHAYNSFQYAPVLWANVAVNNSRAIDKAGVNYMSTYHDGFGVMMVIYEKMSAAGLDPHLDPSRPNVIGFNIPRCFAGLSVHEQAVKGRTELLSTAFSEYERKIREELVRLLGPWGFDPKRDIEAISISRWGHHGYVFPYPGIFTDGTVDAAKKPFGRIAFAHTDLEKFSHMMGGIGQGYRAAQEVSQRA
jgi:spermidine dehydrogenase